MTTNLVTLFVKKVLNIERFGYFLSTPTQSLTIRRKEKRKRAKPKNILGGEDAEIHFILLTM